MCNSICNSYPCSIKYNCCQVMGKNLTVRLAEPRFNLEYLRVKYKGLQTYLVRWALNGGRCGRLLLWLPVIRPEPCSDKLASCSRCRFSTPAFRQTVAKGCTQDCLIMWILCCRLWLRQYFPFLFCFLNFRYKWAIRTWTPREVELQTHLLGQAQTLMAVSLQGDGSVCSGLAEQWFVNAYTEPLWNIQTRAHITSSR